MYILNYNIANQPLNLLVYQNFNGYTMPRMNNRKFIFRDKNTGNN